MTKHLRSGTRQLLCCLVFLPVFGFISACESTLMREFNHHMSGNDLQNAQGVVQQELSRNSQDPEANYLMGNLLSRQQNYAEANTYFDRSLNASTRFRDHIEFLKERNYRLEFNSGDEAWEEGNARRAAQRMDYASQIFPDRIEVYPILGKAYEEINQAENARKAYSECLRYDDLNYQCVLNLASLNYSTGRYAEAVNLSESYLKVHSQNKALLKILAYSHFELGQLDKSEEAFEKFLAAEFNYNELKQYAVELNNRKEIYRAEKYFRRCLERNQRDRDVLSALSSIYLETGNYRLMVEANERLVSMDPDNRSLKQRLMLSYELYGDIDNYKAVKNELGIE